MTHQPTGPIVYASKENEKVCVVSAQRVGKQVGGRCGIYGCLTITALSQLRPALKERIGLRFQA